MLEMSEEVNFTYQELFFSITDSKGLIKTGNEVFQRISGYPWGELLHKPHNVIRHPDMPKGVFALFWQYLKEGKAIGALVKNRSKSGQHYWVFALAMPVADGYLSVRFKPSGEVLALAAKIYQELRQSERSARLSPDESKLRLLGKLQELGFKTYDDFMAEALNGQFQLREAALSRPKVTSLSTMGVIKSKTLAIVDKASEVLKAFQESLYVPLNLQIYSKNSGQNGWTVTVVADQYQKVSKEIAQEMSQFEEISNTIYKGVSSCQFLVGASKLLIEVSDYLKHEGQGGSEAGFEHIQKLCQDYWQSTLNGLEQTMVALNSLTALCERLGTAVLGLELVRLSGEIELSRHASNSDGKALLEGLSEFQTILRDRITEVSQLSHELSTDTAAVIGEHRKSQLQRQRQREVKKIS